MWQLLTAYRKEVQKRIEICDFHLSIILILRERRDSLLWKVLDHISHFSYKGVDLTNRMWFSFVCTLIDNHMRHHRGQNIVDFGLLSGNSYLGLGQKIFFNIKFPTRITTSQPCQLKTDQNMPMCYKRSGT